jgi:class 3 adenylate cyclase
MDEISQVKQAIAALEGQRIVLGDAVVDTALAPLREKLLLLQRQEASEQRRIVTVLFSDVSGFTAMAEHMDPEDVREIINEYFSRWTVCIEQYGGVLEKFIGDAVMAVFGLLTSREDDPENAIRAALAMRGELDDLNNRFKQVWGVELFMRVGIHTGPVVVRHWVSVKGKISSSWGIPSTWPAGYRPWQLAMAS